MRFQAYSRASRYQTVSLEFEARSPTLGERGTTSLPLLRVSKVKCIAYITLDELAVGIARQWLIQ